MQIQSDAFLSILYIILAAMGIFALLLTMGYMIYGEEDEE
jgi:TM2 domain-containing membrane protein YozV